MRSFEKVGKVDHLEGPATEGDERAGRSVLAERFEAIARGIFTPVDIASLAYFRIAFGLVMLWEVWRYFNYGWIGAYYIDPVFHFSYYGFGWVQPWAGVGMYLHFFALGVLALCIALGLFYRVAAVLFFFGFSYVFLLDQTQYLNHFYFVALVSLLMIFVPAHRAFSVDARRRPRIRTDTVPFWAPAMLAFQMGIVYFYGGIAKINADWLRGEPMRMWLAAGADRPVVGWLFAHPWAGYFFSYSGLLLDLLIVPFLLWKKTRLAAFAVITAFHLTNAWMFQIGIFPWLAIAATAMFFPFSWPRRFVNYLRGRDSSTERAGERPVDSGEDTEEERSRRGEPVGEPVGAPGAASSVPLGIVPGAARRGFSGFPGSRRAVILSLLALFVAVQLFLPLRHFAYPGNVSWTEEGHRFAWHMKLRSAEGLASFRITTQDGQITQLDPADYVGELLSERQAQKMSYQPDMILQFAHALEENAASNGYEDVEVSAGVIKSLNDRDPQRLIAPEVDLTEQTRSLATADWIVPLKP